MTIDSSDETRVWAGTQEIEVERGIAGALRTLRWTGSLHRLEVANGRRRRRTEIIAISLAGVWIFC